MFMENKKHIFMLFLRRPRRDCFLLFSELTGIEVQGLKDHFGKKNIYSFLHNVMFSISVFSVLKAL